MTKSGELAQFFAAFHEVYPHSLPRSRRRQIWAVAQQLFNEEIAIQEAFALSGIPIDIHEADLKDADRRLADFFKLLVALIVLLGLGYGGGAAGHAPSRPPRNPSPETKQRVFSQLFEKLEEDEEPEEWIPVQGPPVPVLTPAPQRKASASIQARGQARGQAQTSGEAKRPRGGRARPKPKNQR